MEGGCPGPAARPRRGAVALRRRRQEPAVARSIVRLRGALAKSEPATNRTPADLLRRVGDLQQALAAWLHEVDAAQLQRTVRTYFGDQTLHQVLERAVWHSAQHARQLAMVLELLDIEPADPLSAADLADLPMPQNVWDG